MPDTWRDRQNNNLYTLVTVQASSIGVQCPIIIKSEIFFTVHIKSWLKIKQVSACHYVWHVNYIQINEP